MCRAFGAGEAEVETAVGDLARAGLHAVEPITELVMLTGPNLAEMPLPSSASAIVTLVSDAPVDQSAAGTWDAIRCVRRALELGQPGPSVARSGPEADR